MEKNVTVPCCYNYPVDFFGILLDKKYAMIDLHEHFIKQTERSRCHILSPNGILKLVVPVKHKNRTGTPMGEIEISEEFDWRTQHWRTICTAYNRSAYFEYYRDDFEQIYRKDQCYLHELNRDLLELSLNLMGLEQKITNTLTYSDNVDNDLRDCDFSSFSPFHIKPYPQVFNDRFGFVPGLSVLDLLFNTGPGFRRYFEPA